MTGKSFVMIFWQDGLDGMDSTFRKKDPREK